MFSFASPAQAQSDKDIVDTAVEAGTFNTLAAALTAADLIEVLKGEGPFHRIRTHGRSFAKFPEGTVESLLLPENKDQLVAILPITWLRAQSHQMWLLPWTLLQP